MPPQKLTKQLLGGNFKCYILCFMKRVQRNIRLLLIKIEDYQTSSHIFLEIGLSNW